MPFDSLPQVDAPVAPLTDTQRVLLRAADLIDHMGLAKFRREDFQDRLCIHGALAVAASGRDTMDEYDYRDGAAVAALTDFLAKNKGYQKKTRNLYGGRPRDEAATWNNHPERTQAEVVDALRCAAAACKA